MILRGLSRVTRNLRGQRFFSERRRRKGDGTKTEIFEEKGLADQDQYFRKEAARQLEELRKQQEKKKSDSAKEGDADKSEDKPDGKNSS